MNKIALSHLLLVLVQKDYWQQVASTHKTTSSTFKNTPIHYFKLFSKAIIYTQYS